MKLEPYLDIFAGESDKDAKWITCEDGLANARIRMERIAALTPGKYFVFSSQTRTILATVDTSKFLIRDSNVSQEKASA